MILSFAILHFYAFNSYPMFAHFHLSSNLLSDQTNPPSGFDSVYLAAILALFFSELASIRETKEWSEGGVCCVGIECGWLPSKANAPCKTETEGRGSSSLISPRLPFSILCALQLYTFTECGKCLMFIECIIRFAPKIISMEISQEG